MPDQSVLLQQQVQQACAEKQPLSIQGGNSKAFYGHPVTGNVLDTSQHQGIVNYEPTELVLTARAGSLLSDIENELAANNQMLAFEPPYFSSHATLGGAIASGLAGPKRPWGGSPRDLVLGCKLLDGQGQTLDFGGEVMKNVAGYDVSRLMAGAHGTLGVLLEVSLKILPKPANDVSLVLTMPRDQAVEKMRELMISTAPLSGLCHLDDQLHIRLSGNSASVKTWQSKIGGEINQETPHFWQQLRDHQLPFFHHQKALWRLSLAPATPRLDCETEVLTDWAGAQRWIYSDSDIDEIREQAAKVGGHATLFRHDDPNIAMFHPLDAVQQKFHLQLKQQFDPQNILNPKRFYNWL